MVRGGQPETVPWHGENRIGLEESHGILDERRTRADRQAEELEVTSLRLDGKLSSRRTIWVVRLGDELYVRSVNGRESAWFRGVVLQHAGRIWAGGVEKDVTFEELPYSALDDQIDGEYRAKYRRYAKSIIDSINSDAARAATLRLVSDG